MKRNNNPVFLLDLGQYTLAFALINVNIPLDMESLKFAIELLNTNYVRPIADSMTENAILQTIILSLIIVTENNEPLYQFYIKNSVLQDMSLVPKLYREIALKMDTDMAVTALLKVVIIYVDN